MTESDTLAKLYKLAQASPKREICGVVASDGQIFPVENIAKDSNQFVMDKVQYFRLLNKLIKDGLKVFCLYHSHPNNTLLPSTCDIKSAKATCYPSLIICPNGTYRWIDTGA